MGIHESYFHHGADPKVQNIVLLSFLTYVPVPCVFEPKIFVSFFMAQEKTIKQQYYILSESFIIPIWVLFAVGKVIQGTVSRDFLLQVSCMNHLPRAPEYPSVKTKF
jgi:hypothetical protein